MRTRPQPGAVLTVLAIACALGPMSCRAGQAEAQKGAEPQKEKGTKAMTKDAMPGGYTLSDGEKKELITIARQTVETYVRTGKKPSFKATSKTLTEKGAAFVTLKKAGDLRGCIGDIIAHQPLVDSIIGNAVNAAVNDPRFEPVQPKELAEIDIEISVLTPLQPVKDTSEIVIGKDGLLLTKGFNRGVFLPQVPVEWNWNLQQYLDHLCGKAGLRAGCWKDATLEKFQAIVFGEKEEPHEKKN